MANRKGAPALDSTASALVDLFADNACVLDDADTVAHIVVLCERASKQDPATYISLLKYKRNIKKGGASQICRQLGILKVHSVLSGYCPPPPPTRQVASAWYG
jgi:hypothetical protein